MKISYQKELVLYNFPEDSFKISSKEQVGLFPIQNMPTAGFAANINKTLTPLESPLIEAEVYSVLLFF